MQLTRPAPRQLAARSSQLIQVFDGPEGVGSVGKASPATRLHGIADTTLRGLPYVGTVAASTGYIVAMVSPQEPGLRAKFNWDRVLRHELTHVVTLQQMHERIQNGEGWRSNSIVLSPNSTLTTGSISHIEFENNLKGPVTSTAPLSVLGQPFSVNGNTVLKGFADVTQLSLGQFLEVSGFVDTDSSIMAARVALDDTSPNPWRISGFITQVDLGASTATIGGPPGQPAYGRSFGSSVVRSRSLGVYIAWPHWQQKFTWAAYSLPQRGQNMDAPPPRVL